MLAAKPLILLCARTEGRTRFESLMSWYSGRSRQQARCIPTRPDLYDRTKSLDLLAALNILIRPGRVPPWLRAKLMERLTQVPLRPDGVRTTLEFVFSAHPSSTVKVSEATVPQTKGANITQEALNLASNLLSTPPASVSPETWYSSISPQLLLLLDGDEGPEVAKVAAYVIGRILGRKTSGAPGMPLFVPLNSAAVSN